VPADQPDFLTATKFVNTLIKAGVVAHRATAPFTVGGKQYPAGSFVLKAAQAFRAHLMDMFEPQDHPDDIPYPGGPPRPPYDVTGYNIAYSMGVKFDRILDGFDGPFEKVTDVVAVTPGKIGPAATVAQPGGYLLSHDVNDAFVAVNRLLKANEEVYWLKIAVDRRRQDLSGRRDVHPGEAVDAADPAEARGRQGADFGTVASRPRDTLKLKPVRIGCGISTAARCRPAGRAGSSSSTSSRSRSSIPATLDAGNLNAKYDVLVFVDGGIPSGRRGRWRRRVRRRAAGGGHDPGGVPSTARARDQSRRRCPRLKKFVENGGTVLTIGSSTALGHHLGLPIRDALVERIAGGVERPLPREKFFIPGTILEARIDHSQPLAYGMDDKAMVMWDESPAFRLQPEAVLKGVKPVAWFDNATPLRSGWAWGQQYLDQAVAIVDAPLGKGRVVLFGPEVLWRAQPHGTFKMFFNGIYYPSATPGRLAHGRPNSRRQLATWCVGELGDSPTRQLANSPTLLSVRCAVLARWAEAARALLILLRTLSF
jgi:hypothetical protein